MKQERLEMKEQCFISWHVCLSSVTYNGLGQPSAQRRLCSPISPRLHLVLKHDRVGLTSKSPVNHKAPERVVRPLGCLLLLEPAQLPCSREGGPTVVFTSATAPKCGLTLTGLTFGCVFLIPTTWCPKE